MKLQLFTAVLILTFVSIGFGQTAPIVLAPVARQQFFDPLGHPLAGGCVATYAAGSTTPLATFTDSSGAFQNTNPLQLDSSGYGTIWISAQAYKFVVFQAPDFGESCNSRPGAQIYTVDNISDIGQLLYTQTVLLNPVNRAPQTVLGPLAADNFIGILQHTTSPGVRVALLDPLTTLDSANPITLSIANPANTGQTVSLPDAGAPTGNLVISPNTTNNTLDCTQTGLNCLRTASVYFEGGGCNSTSAASGWDTFTNNAPTVACITGNNIQKGVLAFPAAATLIQEAVNSATGAGTCTVDYPVTTTAGDLLVIVVGVDTSRTISGITDGTNTYTKAKGQTSSTFDSEIWYKANASVVSGTVTATLSASGNCAIQFLEYSGVATSSPLDQTSSGSGTSTAVDTGQSPGTAQNSELVLAAFASNFAASVTGSSGYNRHIVKSSPSTVTMSSEGKIQNVTAQQSGQFTLSSSLAWAATLATFKTAVAAATSAQRGWLLPAYYLGSQPVNATIKWQGSQGSLDFVGGSVPITLTATMVCSADGGTDDPAFNAGSSSTPNVPQGTAQILQSTTLSSLNMTGCGPGSLAHFKILRNRYATDGYEGYVYVNGAGLSFGISQ